MNVLLNASMLLLGAVLSASVHAQDGSLVFEQAWIRAAPPSSVVMAGYVRILNLGAVDASIESVASDAFGAVHLHEMREVDGVMKMRSIEALSVAAGESVALAPGGLHLMLMRPTASLDAGDRVQVEFVLKDGSRQRVDFEVRSDAPR